MLAEVVTVDALMRLAGPAVFARGVAYWEDEHVLACDVAGQEVAGAVKGSMRYLVRLASVGGALVAQCTCPVDAPVCKHAVALGLAYLARQGRVERGAGVAGLGGGGGAASKLAVGFARRAELEAWAAEHLVTHALWMPADVVLPRLPPELAQRYGMRYVLGRLALRDVASLDSASRLIGVKALEAPVVEAAYAALIEAAGVVRDGCAEEVRRRDRHDDPVIAPLWARLLEVRQVVRRQAGPRPRAARAAGSWRIDAAAGAVIWREPERVVRPHEYGTIGLSARLGWPAGGAAALDCTCAAPRAWCTHSLALIDATLDRLEAPAGAAEARVLAEELLRPAWSRLLIELDALEARSAKPRPVIEVWWSIERELGSLTLAPTVKKQLKRGTMSAGARPTVARLLDEHRDSLADVDRRIAEHVLAWAPVSRGGAPASRAAGSYPVRAFQALVGHPRAFAEWSDAPIAVTRHALGFTARVTGDHICLEPSLDGTAVRPEQLAELLHRFAADEPLVVEQPEHGRCLVVDVNDDARQLWALLDKHGDEFPPESHAALLDRLSRMEARVPLVVPPEIKGRELASRATTVARLRLLPDVTLELELWTRPGAGAPLYQPGSGPRDVLLAQDGERGYVRRTLTDEPARARAVLAGLPMASAEEGPPFCYRLGDPEQALRLVAALQTPPPGLEVEWLDGQPTVTSAVGPEALKVYIERRRDWFGITGELKLEAGRLELAVLLDAARRQQRYVRVDAQRWVELSDTLRQRLLAVADQTYTTRQQLELSPGAVPAIRALAEAGAEVETGPDWQQLTARLAASTRLAPRPPAALTATLRDYQIEGHAWLSRVAAWGAGACLADDMGLGKTVQAIAVLLDRARHGPALVLAPTSVAINWAQELARFAPSLTPVMYGEQADRAAALGKLRKKDVVIASYGLLVRDAERLAATPFATLVLDEAQALKNAGTRRARAARKLDARFRIAMSGTPFENHLGELWSLFAIIFPGLLGSWDQFRERFAGPIERAKDADARAALSRVLQPFLLRRTKHEVARELPSRTEILVPVALSAEEWELYETARLAAVAQLERPGKAARDEQHRFRILAALTRLRLLASHPRLYDGRSAVASSKLRRLLELCDELRREGHRALIFSQFTSHLALVREALGQAGHRWLYLDGETPAGQRAKRVAAFQAGEAELFLISLKAGGTGINLTAADYVIHLDPWWNPAVEDQATDRAHRIGQTKPVTVYRLVARGTIEEKILAMHDDKRALVAGVLDGTDVAARLSTKDLLALLSATQGAPIPEAAEPAEPAEPGDRDDGEPPPPAAGPAPGAPVDPPGPQDELAAARRRRAARTSERR
ncbi:MAG TPA: DEAD/DEAH box helicase [Kofleriaceae bacterium]|nr:DEAD/DEAH box helicase [Kofleriaceae bacterium]